MYQPKGVPTSSLAHNNVAVNNQSLDCAGGSMDPISGGNNNPSLASKQRLRWTNELHERFVDAVAQLGGPDSKFLDFHFVQSPSTHTPVTRTHTHKSLSPMDHNGYVRAAYAEGHQLNTLRRQNIQRI